MHWGSRLRPVTLAVMLALTTLVWGRGSSAEANSVWPSSCSPQDITTGGGWIAEPPGTPKRTIGVVGGVVQNPPNLGHVVYVNHGTKQRLEGRVTLYLMPPGNVRQMAGRGEVRGQAATFQLDVIDNGQPGTSDGFVLRYQILAGGGGADGGTLGGGNFRIHTRTCV